MSHLYVQRFYHETQSHNSTKEHHTESDEKYHHRQEILSQITRLLAVLHKSNGRTFADIAKEHGVSIRSVQRWISANIQMGNLWARNKENK